MGEDVQRKKEIFWYYNFDHITIQFLNFETYLMYFNSLELSGYFL